MKAPIAQADARVITIPPTRAAEGNISILIWAHRVRMCNASIYVSHRECKDLAM